MKFKNNLIGGFKRKIYIDEKWIRGLEGLGRNFFRVYDNENLREELRDTEERFIL